jgi:hypothetical protein
MQYFKNTHSCRGGCAFLESGCSVKDFGMARFIFAAPGPGPARPPAASVNLMR